ncbi:MAG: LysM peptidoglycan-binding domain-containing protein [Pseudomonadota bacterium]
MHRPLIIVGAFIVVTVGLILFQPKRTPPAIAALPSAPLETDALAPDASVVAEAREEARVVPEPLVEVTRTQPEPLSIAPDESGPAATASAGSVEAPALEPLAAPQSDVVEADVVEADVAEAPAPTAPVAAPRPQTLLAPAATAQADAPGGEALFSGLTENRPQLLTTTARDANGNLLPSLRSIAPAAGREALAQDTTPLPAPVAIGAPLTRSTVTLTARRQDTASATPPAAAEEEVAPLELQALADVAATLALPPEIGNAELRAKLAQAPTRAVHTVRLGDSLLTLALRYYGDANKSEMILEANRRHLGADGDILIGQILRIPDIEGL